MSANRLEHYRRLLRRIKHSKGNYRGAPRKEILDLVDELRRTGWQLKDICTELGIAKHRCTPGEKPWPCVPTQTPHRSFSRW